MSEALAGHHLEALLAGGLVRAETEDNYRRFFVTGSASPSRKDAELLGLLRQRLPLQISMYLLENGVATNREIALAFGLAKSTASYHVARLLDRGVLRRSPEGALTLADPAAIEQTLVRWRGPATITGRFVRLWEDFYGSRARKNSKS